MQKNSALPQWLIIIGQSGSGKGTVAAILNKWYQRLDLPVLSISTGQLIRDCMETNNTYLAQVMKQTNDRGLAQPHAIPSALCCMHLVKFYQQGQYILHEGSPRSEGEFKDMISLVFSGYIKSMQIIEIKSPDKECFQRLWKRTETDKREDLSKEGFPGVPDPKKIRNKLGWWKVNRPAIIKAAKAARVYAYITNGGTVHKHKLEQKLIAHFRFPQGGKI